MYIYSDCNTEWQDCIEEDERYLVEKLRFYEENKLSDRCTQNQENCSTSAYPGCNLSPGSQNVSSGYIRSLNQQRYRRQVPPCGKCGCAGECLRHCRVLRNSNGVPIRRRCERISDRKKIPLSIVPDLLRIEIDNDVQPQ